MPRLLCFVGLHDWRLECEVDVPGNGTENPPPSFYEVGGVDWHLHCARCSTTKVEQKRGVWLPCTYPPLEQ